jgi:hypothetical protein
MYWNSTSVMCVVTGQSARLVGLSKTVHWCRSIVVGPASVAASEASCMPPLPESADAAS